MSNESPTNPSTSTPAFVNPGSGPKFIARPQDSSPATKNSASNKLSAADEVEAELVAKNRIEIRALLQEISELAHSDCTEEKFYEGILTRLITAVAAVGGAVWVRESMEEPISLKYQINLKQSILASDKTAQTRHSLLLNGAMNEAEPTLYGPHTGDHDPSAAGNPTDHILMVSPIRVNQEVLGLIEVFQRANVGPGTQAGNLRFVAQVAELAAKFIAYSRLRNFAHQQSMWQQLEHFIRAVHQGLDTKQTVYTIANEGRRLVDSDRLSVAMGTGRNCKIEAVSGLDSIERRADQVKKLGELAATVIRTGRPLWYDGDDTDLPPQIEKRLHEYVDKSHSKMLAIIPLKQIQQRSAEDAKYEHRARATGKPVGAVIIEQLKDSRISPALRQRAEVLAAHSETALSNALDHNSIFLMPLWRLLGGITSQFRGGKLFRTTLLLSCLTGIAFFLAVFPYPFGLGAKGSLIPETQTEVFAQVDGVLQEVYVSDNSETFVRTGQPLARMTNSDLMVVIENLQGQIEEAKQKLHTNQILQSKKLDPVDRQMIAGEIRSLNQTIISINNELQLKIQEAQLLHITSPTDGQVVNWQVRQNLLRRPVLRGQNLMTIVDPNTRWQIELEMPERRLAHLIRAMQESDEPLKVTFGLVSHPGSQYEGRILRVDRQLDVHSDNGNTALVRVGFNNRDVDLELLRAGTRVTAKVDCGTRSIGYVMFHELIETIQSSVLFWL